MNKDGKIFGKINIIDLLAVLILLVALVGIGIRFTSTASKSVTDKTEFSYVVEIDDVRIYTVNALGKKGLVTDKQGNIIGEITNVEYDFKKEQKVLSNGNTVMVSVPEKYTAQITLKASGKESEDAYFVGENTELSVGSTLTMNTKYANCSGKIKSVEKVKNQGE